MTTREDRNSMLHLATAPEGLLDDDTRLVRHAAAVLQLPEFAFFHVAHRQWFGDAASDGEVEPHFVRYLFRRHVPPWVRHLAREVVQRSASGPVAARDYRAEPLLPPPPDARTARLRRVFLALVYGACFALFTLCAL